MKTSKNLTMAATAVVAALLPTTFGIAGTPADPQKPAISSERLPLVEGGLFPASATRSNSLNPGEAREYILPLNPGDRFSVLVRGDDSAGMHFAVFAPSERKALYDAPVTKNPYRYAGVARIAADYRVRVYRAETAAPPKTGDGKSLSASFTLSVVRR